MIIRGTVETVIFNNVENGYAVVDMDVGGELVTAVGIFPSVTEGEYLSLSGEMKNNPRFGEQFAVENVEYSPPSDIESIIKYLSSGLFYGIGEVKATNIVQKFGAHTMDIIQNNPERLSEVKGISVKAAGDISASYKENIRVKDTIIFLQEYGISMKTAFKIFKAYGENTKTIILNNPYQLVEDVDGIGFYTADEIAKKIGIESDSVFRIKAAVIYLLNEASLKGGNTYLPEEYLVSELIRITDVADVEKINNAFDELILQNQIITEEDGENSCVMLRWNYYLEKNIAKKLVELVEENTQTDIDIEAEIAHFERLNSILLHDNQKKAIEKTVLSRGSVITGGPGTGKTTIIKCLIEIYKKRGQKIELCAPTGRAAKRMSEATGEDAKTIHRLLGVDFKDQKISFMFNDKNPLESDIVIVDEISMADIYIFHSLVKALKRGAKLVLVGDKDQLPSVGAGNVLSDIIESKIFEVSHLTEIYRQAKESLIIVNAHKINNGEMPIIDKADGDFFFEQKSDSKDISSTVCSLVTKRLPAYLMVQPEEIQVMAPIKKGEAGTINLNKILQNELNPEKKSLTVGDTVFRMGDKVMQISNNYQVEWKRTHLFYEESGKGVFNGDIGHVKDITGNELTVEFEDGKIVKYDSGNMDELMLAYAISIHKSQGSEFNVCVIAITPGSYKIMTRNLIYTAVTRAKKMAVIVGDRKVLYKMVKNDYLEKRYSNLLKFIKEEKDKYESI